jgi:hypothetical protein
LGGSYDEDKRVPKRALQGNTEKRRPVGRPRGRWSHAVDIDAMMMMICRKWRRTSEDRDSWQWRIDYSMQCHRRGGGRKK